MLDEIKNLNYTQYEKSTPSPQKKTPQRTKPVA